MVSRSPGPSKRKAPTELDSVGTRQDGCQAGGQNYRILRSYRRLGGRLAGSGYGGLCLLESAESSPPSKAQGAMTESRRGPLLASERTPRKAPASWTLVAAEPALRGGSGAVTNCCHAAKPLSPITSFSAWDWALAILIATILTATIPIAAIPMRTTIILTTATIAGTPGTSIPISLSRSCGSVAGRSSPA